MRIAPVLLLSFIISLIGIDVLAQPAATREIRIRVTNPANQPLSQATVSLYRADSSLVRHTLTDSAGIALFRDVIAANSYCKVSMVSYQPYLISLGNGSTDFFHTAVLKLANEVLSGVTVTAKKPFLQFHPDKTVVNVEAGITNAGTSVLEVLEKSPGITVDRDGNISMKGRANVQVMIDGKLTQLSGADLQNLLSGMNASQVETIELMDNPPAKYDAAGNAGLINIRTKKLRQKGFNGNFTIAYGQGQLPKNNNTVQLNYRNGDFNFFFSYGLNASRNLMDLYASRTYFKKDGTPESILEQPYHTRSKGITHSLRAGMDYYLSKKTTLGMTLSGLYLTRNNAGKSTAVWQTPSGITDSAFNTTSLNTSKLQQGGINLNGRHVFDATQELSVDVDMIGYSIKTNQYFENILSAPGAKPDASRGSIPTDLKIFAAKADYSKRFGNLLWESGWKSSRVETDNLAGYELLDGNTWKEDLGKSNHFLYTEYIHALYTSMNQKIEKWSLQGGLRYENTSYQAKQLGNAAVKDSSFNRKYNSVFPTAFVTYQLDSSNNITFQAGRRIDRPGFQKLNPFTFIINKYTFQRGNPYFKPQYTWNFALSHVYKEMLTTSFSYNYTKDYFSQIFLTDTATGMVTYTEGNVGKMQNLGLSVSTQLPVTKWWTFSGQATLTHKIIDGELWKKYHASITQVNFSINNQFRFKKGWAAELSGFYLTKNQNDLQEVLNPTGQLSAGISKQVWNNKGTFRLTMRDIFYTQIMGGWSYFETSTEYFELLRDTRVATISFTYRFGKAMKLPAKRNTGGANSEIERVGSVN